MHTRIWQQGAFAVAALALLTTLTGCLPVPLGDPANGTADSRFFGVWEWRDAHLNRVVIRPWDQRTYVVEILTADPAGEGGTTIAPRSRDVYKGWLTDVKGQTFLTLQPTDSLGVVNGDDRPPTYLIARIKFEGTALAASGLDPNFKPVRDAKSPADLERAIAAHLDDPKLFGSTIVAGRWTTDQMKHLDALHDAFRNWRRP